MIFIKLMLTKRKKNQRNFKNSHKLKSKNKIILIKLLIAKKEYKLCKILKNNIKIKQIRYKRQQQIQLQLQFKFSQSSQNFLMGFVKTNVLIVKNKIKLLKNKALIRFF